MRFPTRPMLALLFCCAVLFTLSADELHPRLVVISIDGMMPSRYTSPAPAKIPTLRRLMSEGVYADGVVGVMPSSTYPSHTTLISGVPPAVHGIYDNRIPDPEGRANGAWYWYSREIKVQTLPTTAHARGLRVAAISWPVSVGLDIDYNVPEFWRSNHPETITLLRALSTPRNIIDAAEIWRGKPFEWPQTDKHRADFARFLIRTYQPELLMVHLVETDSAQHDFGPDSPQALEAHERLDGYIGDILGTLKESGLADTTNVAVVSDHGFLPIAQQLQLNTAFNDASFGVDMADGFYTGAGTSALMGTPTNKGGHGFDPARPALRASFIASGPAFTRRGSLGIVRMTQIAPTLARVLGVGLAPQADTALDVFGGTPNDK